VVITCHDLISLKLAKREIPLGYEEDDTNPVAVNLFIWSSKYISKAARLIANSHATKDDMTRLISCKEEKIKIIYYCVDEKFRIISDKELLKKRRYELAKDAKHVLLSVGNRCSYKNFSGLLHTLGRLVKRYGKDIFVIKVGGVSDAHIRLIKKLNLSKYIHLISESSVDELSILYNLSDLFIFPSLYEGFGWPAVEAMACGIPVISSDKGGLKEAVGDASYIIDPYDADNMTKGIIKALEDKPFSGLLIEKGLERVKRLSAAEMAYETYSVYKETLGSI
jgi:glycosyltransferase involved in cell wall biosynthesis